MRTRGAHAAHVKLPDGTVQLVKPPFAGKRSGFTLLFEALVPMLAPQMPMAAVARTVGISEHRAWAICRRDVALALQVADSGQVKALAIDETARARAHDYITLAADAAARRMPSVTEGRDVKAVRTIVEPMKEVAALVRRHLEGIVAWAQTRQTNGILEALETACSRPLSAAPAALPASTRSGPPSSSWSPASATSGRSVLMPVNPLKFKRACLGAHRYGAFRGKVSTLPQDLNPCSVSSGSAFFCMSPGRSTVARSLARIAGPARPCRVMRRRASTG
jgi:hypothetical protein